MAGPSPRSRLRFPSLAVAGTDDPYGSLDYAREMAEVWGSGFRDVGPRGHINADSGLGDWPEGMDMLRSLVSETERD